MAVGIAGLRVINFVLSQNEGEAAILSVEAGNPGIGGLAGRTGQHALSGAGVGFQGYLHAAPGNVAGARLTAEFIGQPDNLDERLRTFANTLRVRPYYDALFFGGERNWGGVDEDGEEIVDDRDPADVLEARSAVFHIDPASHTISLSDYLDGEAGDIDVGTHFDAASLSTAIVGTPVAEITADLTCEWNQTASGMVNIAPRILPGWRPTLTPIASISERGGIGGDSGWTIGSGTFRQLLMQTARYYYTGSVETVTRKKFNPVTEELEDMEFERHQVAPLKRFDIALTHLDASYSYSQARREVVSFRMGCDAQAALGQRKKEKFGSFSLSSVTEDTATPKWREGQPYESGDIVQAGGKRYRAVKNIAPASEFSPMTEDTLQTHYRIVSIQHSAARAWTTGNAPEIQWREMPSLAALPDARAASFFDTPRGREAALHLALRMRAYLRRHMRVYHVTFRGTWEDLAGVTLRHTVSLSHPALPGGSSTGKVVAYRKVWRGEDPNRTRYVEVTIGCCAGNGSPPPEPLAFPGYSSAFADGYAQHGGLSKGISSASSGVNVTLSGPVPIQPIDPYRLGDPGYAVIGVSWQNDLARQLAIAGAADYAMRNAIENKAEELPRSAAQAVSDSPTSYEIRMRSLRSGGVITRNLKALTSPALAPRHITI